MPGGGMERPERINKVVEVGHGLNAIDDGPGAAAIGVGIVHNRSSAIRGVDSRASRRAASLRIDLDGADGDRGGGAGGAHG